MLHSTRHFSELRADGVESNLFQYHLKHLLSKELVRRCQDGYELASKGLYYADRFSPEFKGERPQPKLITIAVLKNRAGEVLLLQKDRQPWVGQYQFPAGKIHAGETTGDAAQRELTEKTGILLEEGMDFRALVHVTISNEGELISDYYGFIFSAIYDSDSDATWWHDVDTLASEGNLAPGIREIYQFEQSGDGQFHQLAIEL